MNKKEAIQFLRETLKSIPELARLGPYNYEYQLWHKTVEGVLEGVFGEDSSEYKDFKNAFLHVSTGDSQREYGTDLKMRETAILSIIKKHEILGIEEKPASMAGSPPKTFIAHGGKSEAREKLYRFLIALNVTPLVIEEEPREGRSINEQVDYYSEQADCTIILGTADDKELKDGKLYPRRNAYIEIGRFQEKFPNKIIYLLEEGASFPSNISEKLYTHFTQESMDEAFITMARELTAFGMLQALKP